jgi:hypothetical protein
MMVEFFSAAISVRVCRVPRLQGCWLAADDLSGVGELSAGTDRLLGWDFEGDDTQVYVAHAFHARDEKERARPACTNETAKAEDDARSYSWTILIVELSSKHPSTRTATTAMALVGMSRTTLLS